MLICRYSRVLSEIVQQQLDAHFKDVIEQIENHEEVKRDSKGRILIDISFDGSWQLARTKRNSPHGHSTSFSMINGVPTIVAGATKHKGQFQSFQKFLST